ncbi:DUF3618 domain-containing protein [Halomonas dongshanensis]|uniref:DUF3618 domain-containing protein n=1 Tax=Halomonas dongshanensis TaxID=2890835 RepID=A0ABT2ECU1_9GAMM|nr:DUF3618 domain-containing protein [Halomonas dongshanensis]MCS2608467.1 DUF3618 domain-containing protein [Halomonas dongshanensis]
MSTHHDQRSAEEIEKDVDRSRERLDATLSELETRFSPQHLLNASYDYLRHGGANEFFSNLGATIKENPVPFLVTGAGLGWLLTAQRSGQHAQGRSRPSQGDGNPYPYAHANGSVHPHDGSHAPAGSDLHRSSPMGSHAATYATPAPSMASERPGPSAFSHPPAYDDRAPYDTASHDTASHDADQGMKERLAEKAHHLSDRAHHWGADMRDSTSHLYHSSQHGISDASRWAKDVGRQGSHFIQEHPLVAGALGFALGAALGGILPSTRKEDAYMGEYRDRLMSEAAERGHEQADKLQHSLHERTEKMKHEKDETQNNTRPQDAERQEHDTHRTPSNTEGQPMRYSEETMPGHNAASGVSGHPGKAPAPHDKDSKHDEHGLTDSDTPSGNTQGDDTLRPPPKR